MTSATVPTSALPTLNRSSGKRPFQGTVVLAPAGHGQLPMIERIHALNLRVIALDRQATAPGLSMADVGLAIDPASGADAANALQDYAVDAVLCAGHDPSLIPLSALARALGLRATPDSVLKTCRYKHLARAWLKDHLPQYAPDFAVAADQHAIVDAWRRIGPAVALKPVDGSGSRGVVIARRADELAWAYTQASAASACGLVIVERFLGGKEVTLDGFVIDGEFVPVATTQRLLGAEPYRVLVGHIYPAALSNAEKRALNNAAHEVVCKMGVQSGPVHSEWILTDSGPRVIEFVFRLGGGCLSAALVPFGCGVDLVGEAVRLALGERPNLECRVERPACLKFITKPFDGDLTIAREQLARDSAGVVDVRVWERGGGGEATASSAASRVGWVIASGGSRSESITNANLAFAAMDLPVPDRSYED